MEPMQIYTQEQIDSLVGLYLGNAERDKLDPIIDVCVENYKELNLEYQIEFKSSAKMFVRTYNFLSSILPFGSVEWEKLSIFLTLLVGKLPRPDFSDNDIYKIVENVELESYRVVAQETMAISLADEDAKINAIPVKTEVGISVPELDTLLNIIAMFHDIWGNCEWTDEDKIKEQRAELPDIVSRDEAYQNAMRYSDAQNARDESDRAAFEAILKTMSSGMELYTAFQNDLRNSENQSFKNGFWIWYLVALTNQGAALSNREFDRYVFDITHDLSRVDNYLRAVELIKRQPHIVSQLSYADVMREFLRKLQSGTIPGIDRSSFESVSCTVLKLKFDS